MVLKIFDDKNLKTETSLGSWANGIKTKYSNMPAKYISLNTLQVVSGVSKEFNPIIVNGNYAQTLESYITYSLKDLSRAFYHYEYSGTLKKNFRDFRGSQAYNGVVF